MLFIKNNGKHLLVFSFEPRGKRLTHSSFHTIRVLEKTVWRLWQRLQPHAHTVPELFFLQTEGGKAWKSLCGDGRNIFILD